jgi:hypothetical protein
MSETSDEVIYTYIFACDKDWNIQKILRTVQDITIPEKQVSIGGCEDVTALFSNVMAYDNNAIQNIHIIHKNTNQTDYNIKDWILDIPTIRWTIIYETEGNDTIDIDIQKDAILELYNKIRGYINFYKTQTPDLNKHYKLNKEKSVAKPDNTEFNQEFNTIKKTEYKYDDINITEGVQLVIITKFICSYMVQLLEILTVYNPIFFKIKELSQYDTNSIIMFSISDNIYNVKFKDIIDYLDSLIHPQYVLWDYNKYRKILDQTSSDAYGIDILTLLNLIKKEFNNLVTTEQSAKDSINITKATLLLRIVYKIYLNAEKLCILNGNTCITGYSLFDIMFYCMYDADFIQILDDNLLKTSNERLITYVKINNTDSQSVKSYRGKYKKDSYTYNKRFGVYVDNNNTSIFVRYNNTTDKYYRTGKESIMEIQSIQTKPDPYGIKANDEYDYPYTHNYLFGKFTKVFLPEQTNSIVSGEMHDVVSNLKQGKPVFIIGYGSSGAGKTSSLIYFNNGEGDQKDGVLIWLCKQLCSGNDAPYNKVKFYIEEFYATTDAEITAPKFIRTPSASSTSKYYEYDYQDGEFNPTEPTKALINSKQPSHKYRTEPRFVEQEITIEVPVPSIKTTGTKPGSASVKPTDIGSVLIDLIDTDRFVKATTNNPNSSRSHVLVYVQLSKENKSAILVIGDLAGVENEFKCGEFETVQNFLNIQRDLDEGRRFYSTEYYQGNGNINISDYTGTQKETGEFDKITGGGYDAKDGFDDTYLNKVIEQVDSKNPENSNISASTVKTNLNILLKDISLKTTDDIVNIWKNYVDTTFKYSQTDVTDLKNQISTYQTKLAGLENSKGNLENSKTELEKNKEIKLSSIINELPFESNDNRIFENRDTRLRLSDIVGLKKKSLYNDKTISDQIYTYKRVIYNDNSIKSLNLSANEQNKANSYLYTQDTTNKDKINILMPSYTDTHDTYFINSNVAGKKLYGLVNTQHSTTISLLSNQPDSSIYLHFVTEGNFIYLNSINIKLNVADTILYNITQVDPSEIETHINQLDTKIKKAAEEIRDTNKKIESANTLLREQQNSDSELKRRFVEDVKSKLNIIANSDPIKIIADLKKLDMISPNFMKVVKIIQARYNRGKNACEKRLVEGKFINKSLNDIRSTISDMMHVKTGGKEFTPNYNNLCINKYCPTGVDCFKPEEQLTPTTESIKSKLFEHIYEGIKDLTNKTNTYTNQAFYKELLVCMFCVFNVARRANNPPASTYIDINELKYFVNSSGQAYNTYTTTTQTKIKDNLLGILDSIIKQDLKNKFLNDSIINKITEIHTRVNKLIAQDATIKYNKVLETARLESVQDIISSIDNHNAASTMGTLEFIDKFAKLYSTKNICTIEKPSDIKNGKIVIGNTLFTEIQSI